MCQPKPTTPQTNAHARRQRTEAVHRLDLLEVPEEPRQDRVRPPAFRRLEARPQHLEQLVHRARVALQRPLAPREEPLPLPRDRLAAPRPDALQVRPEVAAVRRQRGRLRLQLRPAEHVMPQFLMRALFFRGVGVGVVAGWGGGGGGTGCLVAVGVMIGGGGGV